MQTQMIHPDKMVFDFAGQVPLNTDKIADYQDTLEVWGDTEPELPIVDVVSIDGKYHVVSNFEVFLAYRELNMKVNCNVYQGNLQDAVKFVLANYRNSVNRIKARRGISLAS